MSALDEASSFQVVIPAQAESILILCYVAKSKVGSRSRGNDVKRGSSSLPLQVAE
jgi:hypothetical protein